MSGSNWQLSGEYMESCNCDYLCPCIYTNPQAEVTHDHCTAALIFRIDKGYAGSTNLNGLCFALLIRSGKVMADGNWIFAGVVDAQASAFDLASRLAIGGDEAGLDEGREHADPRIKFVLRNFNRRQVLRDRAFLEGLARGFRRLPRGVRAMQQRGRGIRQRLLGLVDLRTPERSEFLDFAHRERRKQFQETRHVRVFGVAPELPVFVWALHVGVEPDRAARGLAHLLAVGGGDQRRRQRV